MYWILDKKTQWWTELRVICTVEDFRPSTAGNLVNWWTGLEAQPED
jgi:hypothetical protein